MGLLIVLGVVVEMVLVGRSQGRAEVSAATAILTSDRSMREASTCHSRADCGTPIKGGLQISFTGWSCTTGFVARDVSTRELYVLTAGHCIANSGLTALWSHHGNDIGRASRAAPENGLNADAGAIALGETAPTNLVYATSSTDVRNVTGLAPNASQTVGSIVCRSGGASGWRCGKVVAADVEARISGKVVRHTWWTDFPSAFGDSGAPVLDTQSRAAGIVIATTSTQTLYSTVEGIAAALTLSPCIDIACE
jgi:hypothetical protein